MTDLREPRFPCQALPEDPREARLLGIYPQRGGERYMQRVKVRQGRIAPGQLRALALLAERHTPDYPLHVTTRQDLELHGVRAESVPAVQRDIAAAGLTTVATCGDSLRNIAMCPGNGFHAGTWDMLPVAAAIERFADSLPWIRSLPRKFKISLSGCRKGCARPWINDLGLVANPDGTLRAVLAGSLGARPGAGMLLTETLEPKEILPLVGAALRLFYAEGERERRTRARLRHLRERLGDAEFWDRIHALARREAESQPWPPPRLERVGQETPLQARLSLPLGDVAPQPAVELADAAEEAKAELRLGLEHDLFVYGHAPVRWSPALEALRNRPTVVACPGSTWCARGIADSRAAARRILRILPDHCGLSIAVAGCPNNCPQSAVADVGLIGCVKRNGSTRQECFRVLVGGGKGHSPVLGRVRDAAVPADHVGEAVAELIHESQVADPLAPHFQQLLDKS
jgi:sulfite reductase beta subunit-like hemoprotein